MLGLNTDNLPLWFATMDPEVIKLESSLKLKIKRYDWLIVDMCPQATNHCTIF